MLKRHFSFLFQLLKRHFFSIPVVETTSLFYFQMLKRHFFSIPVVKMTFLSFIPVVETTLRRPAAGETGSARRTGDEEGGIAHRETPAGAPKKGAAGTTGENASAAGEDSSAELQPAPAGPEGVFFVKIL